VLRVLAVFLTKRHANHFVNNNNNNNKGRRLSKPQWLLHTEMVYPLTVYPSKC